MENKTRNIVVTSVFIAFIAFFVTLCTITHFNPKAYSFVEKRDLAQFPSGVTFAELLNNKTTVDTATGETVKSPIGQFEDYTVDQFPFKAIGSEQVHMLPFPLPAGEEGDDSPATPGGEC